jgi:hypothetical protein
MSRRMKSGRAKGICRTSPELYICCNLGSNAIQILSILLYWYKQKQKVVGGAGGLLCSFQCNINTKGRYLLDMDDKTYPNLSDSLVICYKFIKFIIECPYSQKGVDYVILINYLTTVMDAYIFLFFCIEVLIIRYDKMISHMMPTCALYSSSKACDPGKDLPYHWLDMCTL